MTTIDKNIGLAPAFECAIEGSRLGKDLTELVSSVEYESSDGIADEIRMTMVNPEYKLCNSPIWRQGNQLDLWIGYGNDLGYIGRGIIAKPSPKFVRDGIPSIEIKGYTKDFLMMENKPAAWKKVKRDTRNFMMVSISEAVRQVASRDSYAFDEIDIDDMEIEKFCPPQKADQTDYSFVKGLANSIGWSFWVDYSVGKKWALHFKNPKTLRVQEFKYTFEHGNGDKSSLLDFDPELSLTGNVTRLQVQGRDPDKGKFLVEEFNDEQTAPDSRYKGDPTTVIDETQTTAGAVIKLFFGDHAIEVVSDKHFVSSAEMKIWAEQWWRRKRENFVVGRGTVVGLPDLRARQTHTLILPDKSLCGDYYFARVRHVFNGSGYLVDFTARKVVT